MTRRLALAVVGAALWLPGCARAQPPDLFVFVASSLSDVMSQLAGLHERHAGVRVRLNVAGSNFLARQIVEGADADVFISADAAQMDVVERAGRAVPGTRADLLTNRLAVVTPPASSLRVDGASDLASAAVGRLALGNPDSVPAGVYARQWLERAGVWREVRDRVVPTLTVRSALAAVRSGSADVAVVFVTDAQSERGVKVAYEVPPAEAPAIRYPAAVVGERASARAAAFLAFLRGPEASAVFTAAGFGLADGR
jgi:molybdate transport system substrate-binding protein